jgi:hypothetical protein
MTKLGAALLLVILSSQAPSAPPPQASGLQKSQARQMLNAIQVAIREGYYDPKFHGIDLNAHFKAAVAKIEEARNMVHAYGIIAQTLIAFEDSHTYFIPPMRTSTVEYGWDMRMIGDACYITAVKPGTDAAAKGLKAGDAAACRAIARYDRAARGRRRRESHAAAEGARDQHRSHRGQPHRGKPRSARVAEPLRPPRRHRDLETVRVCLRSGRRRQAG